MNPTTPDKKCPGHPEIVQEKANIRLTSGLFYHSNGCLHNTSPEKEVEITPLGKDLGAYAKDHPAKEPCYVDSVVEEFRDFWVSLFGTSFGGNSKKIEQFLRRVVSGANLEGFSRGAQQEFDRAKITNKEYYETGCTQRTQEIIEIAESLKKECLLCERIPGRVCHLYSHNYALDRLLEELKG